MAIHTVLAACGGFLTAVLWMDLMFDVQVWLGPPAPAPLPEVILASIAGYYARVTTEADPMGRLIGAVMLVTVAGTAWTIARAARRGWPLVAFVLCGLPIGLAAARVVPNAVALGRRAGPVELDSELARSILMDHLVCLVLILAFTAIQIRAAARAALPAHPARPTARRTPAALDIDGTDRTNAPAP